MTAEDIFPEAAWGPALDEAPRAGWAEGLPVDRLHKLVRHARAAPAPHRATPAPA